MPNSGPRANTVLSAVLKELLERAKRAQVCLSTRFNETESYINEKVNNILNEFNLTEKESIDLLKFKKTFVHLLNEAHAQARLRLSKLIDALEKGDENALIIEQRSARTLHVRPRGAAWFAIVTARGSMRLPIHGVNSSTVFPQILKDAKAIAEAQAGWAASDEGINGGGGTHPLMDTTQEWQLLAWAAVRYGTIDVKISGLFLRKKKRQASCEGCSERIGNIYKKEAKKCGEHTDGATYMVLR